MERYCRCRHAEASHEAHGLDGCFWCKCKCFKFDRTESQRAETALIAMRMYNSTGGLFQAEEPTK